MHFPQKTIFVFDSSIIVSSIIGTKSLFHAVAWHRTGDKPLPRQMMPQFSAVCMMTSSNGNIFRITGPLCGEFTGEFPSQRPVTRSFDVFFDLSLKANNGEARDYRRFRVHYDVIVMGYTSPSGIVSTFYWTFQLGNYPKNSPTVEISKKVWPVATQLLLQKYFLMGGSEV